MALWSVDSADSRSSGVSARAGEGFESAPGGFARCGGSPGRSPGEGVEDFNPSSARPVNGRRAGPRSCFEEQTEVASPFGWARCMSSASQRVHADAGDKPAQALHFPVPPTNPPKVRKVGSQWVAGHACTKKGHHACQCVILMGDAAGSARSQQSKRIGDGGCVPVQMQADGGWLGL